MLKFLKWFLVDQFMLGMGGGGGGGTTTSTGTTYQTNIPEYAQPYVETMLGATQKQLFDMEGDEITGFKPYKPYSTNVSDYIAPMSPLQQQAIQQTGQLQTPGQFGDATTLAGVAGLGSLGAGQQYARNVTDPSMMQAYMSPYQQSVTDIAKMNAVREAQIAQQAQNLGAARQGTYGGARQLLAQTEREKNLLSNLSNIQAQGSQSAFDRAMQAQQFGSTLGMQGYGQAGQAASTLGQLGGQQLGAQRDIIGLRSQLGAQQQALEQQKINQAIQDYATAQQYPIMQLGVMSNMLRGLPMQATQTQTYQAAPNPLTQGIGTVGALGSLANIFKGSSSSGGREGGLPSEFKPATGIKSYSVGSQVKGKLYDMSVDDLRDYIKETPSPIAKELAEDVLRDKVGKASGGIIAFKEPNEENNQGVVKEDPEMVRQAYIDAAKMKTDKNETVKKPFPTGVGPVNVGPTNIPNLDKVIANRQLGLPKDFPSELSYEADKARTEFQQKVIEQGGQLKPTTKFTGTSTVPMTDEQRMAGFRAALDQTAPASTGAPPPPAGIKAVAPVAAPANKIAVAAPGSAPAPAPAAAPANKTAAAAPDTKLEFPTTGNPALDKYFKNVLEKASKPPETVEEEIAKKEKYLGPDDSVQKERARLMAAKSNIQDEKFREFNMNAALFFAKMATTPGNVAFAALTALKNTIPTFVASDKEKGKLFREIDKGLVDLDKAARLEKSGDYDKAREIIAKRSKTLNEEIARPIAFFQAENVAKIGERGKIKAAQITAGPASDLKERNLDRQIEEGIDKVKNSDVYKDHVKALKLKGLPDYAKNSTMQKRVETAEAALQKFETDFNRRRRERIVDDTSSTTAPGGGLTQNKDGTFTYTPKT